MDFVVYERKLNQEEAAHVHYSSRFSCNGGVSGNSVMCGGVDDRL